MNISPISIQYFNKNLISQNRSSVSNPIYSENKDLPKLKYPISFCGLISNSELIKNGYNTAKIKNNKISNQDENIIITSADNFLALQNSPNAWNKKIVLANDIDLNGAVIKPIGNAQKPFNGEFDGNGCKISNFKIDMPNGRNIGLFGKCENAKISNIEIEKAYIKGKQQVGGFAGYASECDFNNCFFQGYIDSIKNAGGLIGTGSKNFIKNSGTKCDLVNSQAEEFNPFDFDEDMDSSEAFGGLIGSDNGSYITGSYSESIIKGIQQIGGLIGYGTNSKISNAAFNGTILGNTKIGSMMGWAENSKMISSYSLSNIENFVGFGTNNSVHGLFNSLDKLIDDRTKNWDCDYWIKSRNKIPRLKVKEKRMSAKELFLEDINNDIKTGNITYADGIENKVKENIALGIIPPKHYSKNDEMLKQIRECSDSDKLSEMFIDVVRNDDYLTGKYDSEEFNNEYDELLLEFVKNPKMDFNKRFDHSYCISCTPLFIITTLNKPYILNEALKRNDVDPTIASGFSQDKTILKRAFDNHIDACTYVILTSPKTKDMVEENLDTLKASEVSPFAKLLLEYYPDIPKLDEETGGITFTQGFDIPEELQEPLQEVQRLQDVQRNCLIDSNYIDSRGNNIVNVLANLNDEKEALAVLLSAEKIGTDLEHHNDKAETPMGHALYKGMPHVTARLLEQTYMPYVRLYDGIDCMLLFSNLENQNNSVNYMEIARNRGLSVNSSDNNGNTPLINSAEQNNIAAIKYLLSHGANPNLTDCSGQSALHKACINENIETINLLLDSYAYPEIKDAIGNTPYEYLGDETKAKISSKFKEVIDMYEISGLTGDYICNYSKTNFDKYNEIYSLDKISQKIRSGQNADCELLNLTKNILLNPDIVNLKDNEQNSILHLAAQSNSQYASECLKAAIDAGMNLDSKNNDGETPLICALNEYLCSASIEDRMNLLRNIKLLLSAEPNVDLTDKNKQSALHKVCQSGNLILFNEILKLNPKINQVDILGKTPFEYIPPNANTPMYYTAEEYLKNNKILKEKK